MARNISFALTTKQFKDRSKRVTRRLGWLKLKAGDRLQACVKCMGLKLGEKPEKLGLIVVVNVCREPLSAMIEDEAYGRAEAAVEGFPEMSGVEFVDMFCNHMKVERSTFVTRIAFNYLTCCCGAWHDPDDYPGAMWDRSEDWCPVHKKS